jgi:hypothetical protein
VTTRSASLARIAIVCALASVAAFAQGGPPLITNDTGTPGDGHWEINFAAATGARTQSGWDIDAPNIDINYGYGERIQLSVTLPWSHRREAGRWTSGAGDLEFAARWRFIDQEKAGVSVAIQPGWSGSWSTRAQRKGLASADDTFSLPLQIAREFGATAAGIELRRNFVAHAPDEWQAGAFVAHDCPNRIQCLAEINTTWTDTGPQTLLNLGLRRPLSEHVILLLSAGRELSHGEDRQQLLFYAGVQFLR